MQVKLNAAHVWLLFCRCGNDDGRSVVGQLHLRLKIEKLAVGERKQVNALRAVRALLICTGRRKPEDRLLLITTLLR